MARRLLCRHVPTFRCQITCKAHLVARIAKQNYGITFLMHYLENYQTLGTTSLSVANAIQTGPIIVMCRIINLPRPSIAMTVQSFTTVSSSLTQGGCNNFPTVELLAHGSQHRSPSQSNTKNFSLLQWRPIFRVQSGPQKSQLPIGEQPSGRNPAVRHFKNPYPHVTGSLPLSPGGLLLFSFHCLSSYGKVKPYFRLTVAFSVSALPLASPSCRHQSNHGPTVSLHWTFSDGHMAFLPYSFSLPLHQKTLCIALKPLPGILPLKQQALSFRISTCSKQRHLYVSAPNFQILATTHP